MQAQLHSEVETETTTTTTTRTRTITSPGTGVYPQNCIFHFWTQTPLTIKQGGRVISGYGDVWWQIFQSSQRNGRSQESTKRRSCSTCFFFNRLDSSYGFKDFKFGHSDRQSELTPVTNWIHQLRLSYCPVLNLAMEQQMKHVDNLKRLNSTVRNNMCLSNVSKTFKKYKCPMMLNDHELPKRKSKDPAGSMTKLLDSM